MTRYSNQPQQPHAIPVYYPQTNGLAVAGCVLSVVGLVVGGLLSPIGLILSLVALGKPTGKGWAWTGVILGFLGSCGWLVAIFFLGVGAAFLAAVGVAGFAIAQSDQIEITRDMALITTQVQQYEQRNHVPPANLEAIQVAASTRLDPWGHPYRYALDDQLDFGFDLISDGEDGIAGNEDDIHLSRLDEYWEDAMRRFERERIKVEINSDGSSSESASGESGSNDEEGAVNDNEAGDDPDDINSNEDDSNTLPV